MIKDKIKVFNNFGLEINSDIKVQEKRVDNVSCLIIDDYFKNPEKTIDNFLSIPFDIGQETIENIFKSDDKEHMGLLKPMGANQIIHTNLTAQLTVNIVDVLKNYDYIPMDSNTVRNYEEFEQMLASSLYTGNYYYPDMAICVNKQKCHPGNYFMNYQVFLSDCEGSENGIAFYNLEYENYIFWKVKDLVDNVEDFETRKDIMDLLNYKYVPQKNYEKYSSWNGDEYFKKIFEVEAKFNRMIIFPGQLWYQNRYDNISEKYFIEGCLNLPSDRREHPIENEPSFEMTMESIDYD